MVEAKAAIRAIEARGDRVMKVYRCKRGNLHLTTGRIIRKGREGEDAGGEGVAGPGDVGAATR